MAGWQLFCLQTWRGEDQQPVSFCAQTMTGAREAPQKGQSPERSGVAKSLVGRKVVIISTQQEEHRCQFLFLTMTLDLIWDDGLSPEKSREFKVEEREDERSSNHSWSIAS